jgi:pimeloyl-ACP methyl ester carboxylesterase
MLQVSPQFIDVGTGQVGTGDAPRRIAALLQAGSDPASGPGVFWLAGFKSDMASTKATALAAWCGERGLPFTRFDYSGHGVSGGRFEDGTIGRWLDETTAVFERLTCGPQIVVGSSMGGYLALLLLRRLQAANSPNLARLKALALIAPAWDMTEELMWNEFPPSAKAALAKDGVWLRPSQYGEPYPITRQLIEEGRNHLLARKTFNPGRPIHIMHGLLDPDVPWEHTLDLESFLDGDWTRVTAIPDGEHRLSRPEDLAELFGMIEGLMGR